MTEIIVRSRQAGKTTELIRRAAETGGYIVCTDRRRARQIAVHARKMGLDIMFPITADEWQGRDYYPPGVRGLLFDDLDRIIQGMTAAPVIAATWTADDPARQDHPARDFPPILAAPIPVRTDREA